MAAAAPGLTHVAPALRERSAPLLAARGLTRRFANGRGVFEIDLEIRAGEFVALTGPSGAGKTTLLRLLAGLEAPDSGGVFLNGGMRRARHGETAVALVFQHPRLVGRLDAVGNVLAGRLGHIGRWRGLLRRFAHDDWQRSFVALERVGLLGQAADRADRLSGGEQQRLMIARALAQQPDLLLADEPVASLDATNAHAVMKVLRDCAANGIAVIASLHQPALVQAYAAREVRIDAGRIVTVNAR